MKVGNAASLIFLVLGIILSIIIVVAIAFQWIDATDIADPHRGNTRNIETNPWIILVLFAVIILSITILFNKKSIGKFIRKKIEELK